MKPKQNQFQQQNIMNTAKDRPEGLVTLRNTDVCKTSIKPFQLTLALVI